MNYEGVLPVLKPAGFTSHDVVAKMRRILGMKRIGHTGTLDPQVTGVLPLCLGRTTRFVEYIQELPKAYEAELTIGYATDTEDWTGEIVEQTPPGQIAVTEEKVAEAFALFRGTIEQVPPMYSAVKVGGKKLYELAREGKTVERKSRQVDIYELEATSIVITEHFPRIGFRVVCSKGTYIRTLCVDIGKALGYPAVMTRLVRTRTGTVELARCMTLEEIERLHRSGELADRLIRADQLVTQFPVIELNETEAAHASQGKLIRFAPRHGQWPDETKLVRAYGPTGDFIGLFRPDGDSGGWRPEKIFAPVGSKNDE